MSEYDKLVSQFGLEAVPASVERLNKLVSVQDADVGIIAKLVKADPNLSKLLLATANPGATKESEYDVKTVDEAIGRLGVGTAFLVAMVDPVTRAVQKTFHTILEMDLKPVAIEDVFPFEETHVLGSASFEGHATGWVQLRFTEESAQKLTATVLGQTVEETTESGTINDVIGELVNMVVGNFKSNLCDAGLTCTLSPPSVTRTDDFKLKGISGGGRRRLAFKGAEHLLFVDISVNPFNG